MRAAIAHSTDTIMQIQIPNRPAGEADVQ